MKRIAVATVSVLALCGVSVALGGVIEDRKETMKSFQATLKEVAPLRTAFDATKAKALMKVLVDGADKMPKEFAAAPKAGEETKAAPAVWTDAAAFKAEIAKFKTDAVAASNATDQASFVAAFTKVTQDCSSCHKVNRLP